MNRALFAALLSLGLAACGVQGKVYAETQSNLHDELAAVDELPPVFGSNVPDLTMESADPAQVTWIVNLDGSEVMRFVAKLEPKGEQSTRMVLDLVGVASGARGDTEQRLKDHPELRRLYLVAMQEQIDSTLEHRPFDASKTYGALAAATAANIGNISRQMDAAAEADRKRDEDNIRKAYAAEAASN